MRDKNRGIGAARPADPSANHQDASAAGPSESLVEGSALDRELEAMVRVRIGALTASGALDAGNGDVIDRLVDHTVAQHTSAIELAAGRRSDLLTRRLAQGRAHIEETSERLAAEESAVRSLAAEIDQLARTEQEFDVAHAPVPGAADAPVTGPDVARLRSTAQRAAQDAARDRQDALRAARVRSAGALRGRLEKAAGRVEVAQRNRAGRRADYQRAVEEHRAALVAYRGHEAVAGAAPAWTDEETPHAIA